MVRIKWIERMCDFLGRYTRFAAILDYVASWIVPLPRPAHNAVAGMPGVSSTGDLDLPAHVIAMASGPETRTTTPNSVDWPFRGDSPTTPQKSHEGEHRKMAVVYDAPWWKFWEDDVTAPTVQRGVDLCTQDKYRGMHGTPCLYAGGSDLRCPRGTVSGWFWSYRTPAGVYFYVDCCGGTPRNNPVYCHWTAENNWCYGGGRAQNSGRSLDYNCTLAIPDNLMMTRGVPGKRPEVVGVD